MPLAGWQQRKIQTMASGNQPGQVDLSDSEVTSAPAKPLTSQDQADNLLLFKKIDTTLKAINSKKDTLKGIHDRGYDFPVAQQQFITLVGIHTDIAQLIEHFAQLFPETAVELQKKSSRVQKLLQKKEDYIHSETSTIAADRIVIRKYFYEVIGQLEIILDRLSIELTSIDLTVNTAADTESLTVTNDSLDELHSELAREKQTVLIGEFGQSNKSVMVKQLHQLTLLLHRVRQLAHDPRLKHQKSQLLTITLHIADAVKSVDIQASNASDLLEETIFAIERQICRREYDYKLWSIIYLPFGWFVNRYQDIAHQKSSQAKVLTGLAFSLITSSITFIFFTIILTVISAYESSSEEDIRGKINSKGENIVEDVETFIANEADLETKQARLAALSTEISEQLIQISTIEKQLIQISTIEEQLKQQPQPDLVNTSETEGDTANQPSDAESSDTESPKAEEIPEQRQLAIQQQEYEERILATRQTKSQLEEQRDILSGEEGQLNNIQQLTKISINNHLNEMKSLQSELTLIQQGKDGDTTSRSLRTIASFVNNESLLNHLRRIILAAFSGAVGSIMSILIRLDKLDEEDIKNPFLLGTLKPLIGAVFGIAIFAILSTRVIDILPANFYLYERQDNGRLTDGDLPSSQPGLVATRRDPLGDLDSQEFYKIFLVAFIAGFSERLASDTLKSVSSKNSF